MAKSHRSISPPYPKRAMGRNRNVQIAHDPLDSLAHLLPVQFPSAPLTLPVGGGVPKRLFPQLLPDLSLHLCEHLQIRLLTSRQVEPDKRGLPPFLSLFEDPRTTPTA
jgi:hypothetical protein